MSEALPSDGGTGNQPGRPSGSRLLQSTGTVGAWTLLSRILGLVRDVVYARLFGASFVMDAFFVAFRIPNIFRRFFAEGAFSQAFVPVFAEYDQSREHAEVRELVSRAAGTLGVILSVLAAVGAIAAPLFITIFAPGFATAATGSEADRFALAAAMLRWTFPYLLFVSLAALAGGVLNTYQRFVAAAFSPVLLNVVLIAALAAASRVQISTDAVHAFPADSPVRTDFDAINSRLDGATEAIIRVVVRIVH